jgi:hypothetical protein
VKGDSTLRFRGCGTKKVRPHVETYVAQLQGCGRNDPSIISHQDAVMSKEQHATANVPIHEILLHDFLGRYTTTIVSPILEYSAQAATTTLLRTRDPTGQRLKHL